MGRQAKCNASRGKIRRPSFVQHRIDAPSPVKREKKLQKKNSVRIMENCLVQWFAGKKRNGNVRVLIEADSDTSCVSNWPNCITSKLSVGCGRSASLISTLDMVRGFVKGAPVTDVNLLPIAWKGFQHLHLHLYFSTWNILPRSPNSIFITRR